MQAQPPHDDTSHPNHPDHRRSRLSCLLDGDSHGASAEDACAAWRDDPHWRATWHRYHLIGDVLRSSELASAPGRDAAFMLRFRERLSAEPPLLAPAPAQRMAAQDRRPRHAWMAPAAVAAGFAAVAGVVLVVRMSQPNEVAAPGATLASGTVPSNTLLRASTQGTPGAAMPVPAPDAAMMRDAEIDRYFRAHRGMAVSPAAAMPGGAPRNVDTIVQR